MASGLWSFRGAFAALVGVLMGSCGSDDPSGCERSCNRLASLCGEGSADCVDDCESAGEVDSEDVRSQIECVETADACEVARACGGPFEDFMGACPQACELVDALCPEEDTATCFEDCSSPSSTELSCLDSAETCGQAHDCGVFTAEDLCSDSCRVALDESCDDGGPGAQFSVCNYGTDCTDCGRRARSGGTGQ